MNQQKLLIMDTTNNYQHHPNNNRITKGSTNTGNSMMIPLRKIQNNLAYLREQLNNKKNVNNNSNNNSNNNNNTNYLMNGFIYSLTIDGDNAATTATNSNNNRLTNNNFEYCNVQNNTRQTNSLQCISNRIDQSIRTYQQKQKQQLPLPPPPPRVRPTPQPRILPPPVTTISKPIDDFNDDTMFDDTALDEIVAIIDLDSVIPSLSSQNQNHQQQTYLQPKNTHNNNNNNIIEHSQQQQQLQQQPNTYNTTSTSFNQIGIISSSAVTTSTRTCKFYNNTDDSIEILSPILPKPISINRYDRTITSTSNNKENNNIPTQHCTGASPDENNSVYDDIGTNQYNDDGDNNDDDSNNNISIELKEKQYKPNTATNTKTSNTTFHNLNTTNNNNNNSMISRMDPPSIYTISDSSSSSPNVTNILTQSPFHTNNHNDTITSINTNSYTNTNTVTPKITTWQQQPQSYTGHQNNIDSHRNNTVHKSYIDPSSTVNDSMDDYDNSSYEPTLNISRYDHSFVDNDNCAQNPSSNHAGNYNDNSTSTNKFAGNYQQTSNTGTSNNDDFGSSSYDYGTISSSSNDTNVPLCPGHSIPCITLTSKTSTNNGRQFYKCSLPECERCDFFQWVDGGVNDSMYTSNNDNTYQSSAKSAMSSGDIKDAKTENRIKFGHRYFRPGQKEVIDHAMQGRDVFVLMPTGGGKSLCYQLPAWCCPGLTVVISPLLSLIQDQIQSLSKLGIDSVFLSSSQDYSTEQVDITRRLNDVSAHGGVKMFYITPEKLSCSNMIQSLFTRLYQKNLLSRFVIDEAHCLSDWGHDFRPDYAKLGTLRREYPQVPIMALTATANGKVVDDAIHALDMRNPHRYVSSFNRPNLRYEVRKKDSKTIDSIAQYIAKRPYDSGVIYCLSRKDCESLSEKIQEKVREIPGCSHVKVSFYHAELDAHERERRHQQWSNGLVSVLCATVAFGMGIDKPDVRYVIHYSMPKSITHYYQESGRAGRDGETAECILYYCYKDKKILEHMIVKSSNDPYGTATRRKVDQLYTCLRYCEDEFRCRRTMQLEFFGETFHSDKCKKTCDNCKACKQPDRKDMTFVAQEIIQLFYDVSKQKSSNMGVTLIQITELFRGSKLKTVTKFLKTDQLRTYGNGSKFTRTDIDRIAHAMIFERILVEESVQNKGGYSSDYVRLGETASKIEQGQTKFFVDFPKTVTSTTTSTAGSGSTTKSAKNDSRKIASKQKSSMSILTSKPPSSTVLSSSRPSTNTKRATTTTTTTTSLRIDSKSKKSRHFPNQQTGADSNLSDGNDTDDDSVLRSTTATSSSSTSRKRSNCDRPLLPPEETRQLEHRIKTLVINWAEEERMIGKSTYYWNIISNAAMKSIAWQVPTTIELLKNVDGIGENVFNEYGARIVRVVACYVAEKNLTIDRQQQEQQQPPNKKQYKDSSATTSSSSTQQSDYEVQPKSSSSSIVETVKVIDHTFSNDDDDDEYDTGIDFSLVDVP